MSAPRSLFAGSELSSGDMMSRAEAQAFLERIVKLSRADTIGVQLGGGYTGNIRFAANRISTSGGWGLLIACGLFNVIPSCACLP